LSDSKKKADHGTADADAVQALHGLLDASAATWPDAPAIRDGNGTWTYADLAEVSRAVAAWLGEQGVRTGDRVLVQVPNRRELAALLFGCSRRGAIFVPINPGTKPFHLRSIFANSEPRIAIVDDGAAEAVRELTDTRVVGLGAVWPDIADGPAPPPVADDVVTGEDMAVLIYTSGSTAAPKAVACPHGPMLFAARAINAMLGYRHDDVVFCRVPLSFDYGLYQILLSCLTGAHLVLTDGEPDFTLLRRIRESGATVVPVVPSLGRMLVTLAERDPGPTGVRLFTNTGAALPQATIDALRARFAGARVARMFGTTECKRITIMSPDTETARPESVGLPLPGTEVLILDADGGRLPAGRTGEIVVRGPHVMAGYWRAPEITARTFRRDPRTGDVLLHTGDYGRLDQDGYLYFEGRRDDMFKHKGTRMSTLEIEAAALDVPGVRSAVVLPPADGGELAICVAADLAPHVVLRELSARLEPAKVPTACHVMEDLPLTLNGKNERKTLAELVRQTAR
jgi:amino acid adenylation domain-containing protein